MVSVALGELRDFAVRHPHPPRPRGDLSRRAAEPFRDARGRLLLCEARNNSSARSDDRFGWRADRPEVRSALIVSIQSSVAAPSTRLLQNAWKGVGCRQDGRPPIWGMSLPNGKRNGGKACA